MFYICMGVFTIFTDNSAYFVTVLCSDFWNYYVWVTQDEVYWLCLLPLTTGECGWMLQGKSYHSINLGQRFWAQVYSPILHSLSAAVWVVAVKQHFAEHTGERNNCCCCKFLQRWPGCLNKCCNVGKKRSGRILLKHEGGEELSGPCPGSSVLR